MASGRARRWAGPAAGYQWLESSTRLQPRRNSGVSLRRSSGSATCLRRGQLGELLGADHEAGVLDEAERHRLAAPVDPAADGLLQERRAPCTGGARGGSSGGRCGGGSTRRALEDVHCPTRPAIRGTNWIADAPGPMTATRSPSRGVAVVPLGGVKRACPRSAAGADRRHRRVAQRPAGVDEDLRRPGAVRCRECQPLLVLVHAAAAGRGRADVAMQVVRSGENRAGSPQISAAASTSGSKSGFGRRRTSTGGGDVDWPAGVGGWLARCRRRRRRARARRVLDPGLLEADREAEPGESPPMIAIRTCSAARRCATCPRRRVGGALKKLAHRPGVVGKCAGQTGSGSEVSTRLALGSGSGLHAGAAP